jgi:carbamoyl-phosphate synthase large subunit
MKQIRVYVSGVSGIVGHGIVKNLRSADQQIQLFGSALDGFSAGVHLVDTFAICPSSDSSEYLPWLSKFLKDNKIDYAIPGIDIDMHVWNSNREVFASQKCIVVLNSLELINITRDKYDFFCQVEKYGFPHSIPTRISGSYEDLSEFFGTYDIIAKPRVGFAKKGFSEIHSKSDFMKASDGHHEDLIFQPNLCTDGYEYTSSVFGDAQGGFSSVITLRRRLSPAGYSNFAEPIESKAFSDTMLDYCKLFKPVGPTNFQFMVKEDQIFLLEINPRFSSSTSMRGILGYNESKMALDYFGKGILPTQPPIKSGKVIRYIEDFYVSP